MGKIRIKTLGDKDKELKQKKRDEARREGKKIAKLKEKTDVKEAEVPAVEEKIEENIPSAAQDVKETVKKDKPQKERVRSKRYQKAKSYLDKTRAYKFSDALKLVRKTSLAKFDATVELHINTLEKGIKGNVTLPHGNGKKIKIAVVDDEILGQIEKGKIDFDVLISHPSFMPRLARLAKVLGPKGLMPNPKNGTISENPVEAAKKFAGSMQFKTESDFPIIHTVIGKASFDDDKLEDNFKAFIKAVGTLKIRNVYLKSTMSPSVRVEIV